MELIDGEYWSYIFTNDIPDGKTPRDVVNELEYASARRRTVLGTSGRTIIGTS